MMLAYSNTHLIHDKCESSGEVSKVLREVFCRMDNAVLIESRELWLFYFVFITLSLIYLSKSLGIFLLYF